MHYGNWQLICDEKAKNVRAITFVRRRITEHRRVGRVKRMADASIVTISVDNVEITTIHNKMVEEAPPLPFLIDDVYGHGC
jgi:hypothetical protein